ncbi:hypothetical protein KI387_034611, partial [Taxus chinensis]
MGDNEKLVLQPIDPLLGGESEDKLIGVYRDNALINVFQSNLEKHLHEDDSSEDNINIGDPGSTSKVDLNIPRWLEILIDSKVQGTVDA